MVHCRGSLSPAVRHMQHLLSSSHSEQQSSLSDPGQGSFPVEGELGKTDLILTKAEYSSQPKSVQRFVQQVPGRSWGMGQFSLVVIVPTIQVEPLVRCLISFLWRLLTFFLLLLGGGISVYCGKVCFQHFKMPCSVDPWGIWRPRYIY